MYIYDLEISMSKKNVPIKPELIDAIKEAIELSNNSFSATRYGRSIQFIKQIDESRIHLQMQSKEPINATRSLSSLSRALVKNENEKGSHILEEYVYNGSVFISKNLGVKEEASTEATTEAPKATDSTEPKEEEKPEVKEPEQKEEETK